MTKNTMMRSPAEKKPEVKIKPTIELDDSASLLAGRMPIGQDNPVSIQNCMQDRRFHRVQRQEMATQIGQVGGNRQIQQMILPTDHVNLPGLIQKEDAKAEADKNVPSPEAPGLTVKVADQIKDHIRKHERRKALEVLVKHLGATGQIDLDLLSKHKMYYSSKLGGEGAASPPGFHRDPVTGKWISKPTPVRIGPDAFGKGLSWLYSSVMHEFQHVLQFQQKVASGTMGQRSLGWLIERQEVEAYATEIINSEKTGMNKHPKQMQETWRRLHEEHWLHLGKKSRKLLNDLYTNAHDIAQKVVGKGIHLPFKPAP